MIERILLPLGGYENPKALGALLSSISPDRRIIVHGMGVVDIPGIEGSMSGAPIGAISMAEGAAEKVSASEKKRVKEFVESFRDYLDENRIEYESSVTEGDPIEEIVSRSVGHDLVVIDSSSVFSFQKEKESHSFFFDLILEVAVPVLFLKEDGKLPDVIGLSSDYGREFHHTLFAFLQLGIFKRSRIIFSHVLGEGEAARGFAPYRDYFKLHGYMNVTEARLKGEKVSAIRRFVETEGVGLLVVGKRGESRLRNFIFGSLTESLIKDPICSLFIYE